MSATNPAETYESYMVPTLFAPWAKRLVEIAQPQAAERVLDVGCGTGVAARQAAPRVGPTGQVTGLDANPNMLAVARAVAERERLAIAWEQGRAESLPYPDSSFALVLCQFALMFFSDRRAALAEMHRVAADGGRLALSVWQGLDRHPFYRTLHEVIAKRLGMSGIQEIFALGGADALRASIRDAGFRSIELDAVSMTARFPNPDGFLAGEIDVDTAAIPSMQHLDPQARQQLTAAIRTDMAAPLRELVQDDHVVIPFHALLVRGLK